MSAAGGLVRVVTEATAQLVEDRAHVVHLTTMRAMCGSSDPKGARPRPVSWCTTIPPYDATSATTVLGSTYVRWCAPKCLVSPRERGVRNSTNVSPPRRCTMEAKRQ